MKELEKKIQEAKKATKELESKLVAVFGEQAKEITTLVMASLDNELKKIGKQVSPEELKKVAEETAEKAIATFKEKSALRQAKRDLVKKYGEDLLYKGKAKADTEEEQELIEKLFGPQESEEEAENPEGGQGGDTDEGGKTDGTDEGDKADGADEGDKADEADQGGKADGVDEAEKIPSSKKKKQDKLI